jgi:hypothetical protein
MQKPFLKWPNMTWPAIIQAGSKRDVVEKKAAD